MPRYWVIAPVQSKKPELFDRVWQFDLDNNLISIGWSELGDISKMSREALYSTVASTYPDKPHQTWGLIANMLWAFYHEIAPGDFVIARRGQKILAAVGRVVRSATYSPEKNPASSHNGFLGLEWQGQPRDKAFSNVVFRRWTLDEISETQYRGLLEGTGITPVTLETDGASEDPNAFVLEKYLEDFIVSNFDTIFKGKLEIYEDGEEADGQQYATDVGSIDILAFDRRSSSFVVIELKKGRPSDQVVGQVLRYMGWVKENLCKDGQTVKGLVICHDRDPKLDYALAMTNDIDVRYYSVSFKLSEAP